MSAAEISKQLRAQKDLIKLAQAVVDWWEKEEHYPHTAHEQPPEFVRLAQKTLEENKP